MARANPTKTTRETLAMCIGSSWLGGNFRDTWSDGEMTLEYRSETGLLHGRRKNGVEFVWEFDAEQNEFYEIEDL